MIKCSQFRQSTISQWMTMKTHPINPSMQSNSLNISKDSDSLPNSTSKGLSEAEIKGGLGQSFSNAFLV